MIEPNPDWMNIFQINPDWLRISPWTVAITIIVVVAFFALAIYYSIRAHRRKVGAGKEELIGRTAEATSVLEPRGTVFIEGERWAAITDEERIEEGEEVIITKVEGLKLHVSRKK